jgi:O-antigen biosynthesis protein WbqP
MLRLCDVVIALCGLIVSAPLLLVLWVVGMLDTGSPIFRQQRVGKGKSLFTLVKFRTMRTDTASVASHLADAASVTPYGALLRRTKLDELPQLWNVLRGEMSLVGPRPCLPSQHELVHAREILGVFDVQPGVTGLAQVSGIDMSTPQLLAETDAKMVASLNLRTYFRLVFSTLVGRGGGDQIRPRI